MAVIFGASTSDFAGDAIRLQHFRHGEATEEERKRPGHSRLSPTKSRLFAKWHLKERESPNRVAALNLLLGGRIHLEETALTVKTQSRRWFST